LQSIGRPVRLDGDAPRCSLGGNRFECHAPSQVGEHPRASIDDYSGNLAMGWVVQAGRSVRAPFASVSFASRREGSYLIFIASCRLTAPGPWAAEHECAPISDIHAAAGPARKQTRSVATVRANSPRQAGL